jgi:hypothetical protein
MKITQFSPLILSAHADDVMEVFEALGFEREHANDITEQVNVMNYSMRDADDHKVDVASVQSVPQDVAIIRMNVDDFDEAMDLLEQHGFRNVRGAEPVRTPSSISTLMTSPSGFSFDLAHHIKEGEPLDRALFAYTEQKVEELLAAGPSSQQTREACQAWKDAIAAGEDQRTATNALLDALDEHHTTVDELAAFAAGAAKDIMGEEAAAGMLAHAQELKAQGVKYCDCPACTAAHELLAKHGRPVE